MLGLNTHELDGIHEVQVGDLEDRNDDDGASRSSRPSTSGGTRATSTCRCPTARPAAQVLDRYLPVITQLRMRHLDDDAWHGDIVVVSHGAAIRLVSAVLAGVDSGFALDHHLGNTEAVVLAPITDGRWSCVQWGALTPPFYPEADVHPVEDALRSADPMG